MAIDPVAAEAIVTAQGETLAGKGKPLDPAFSFGEVLLGASTQPEPVSAAAAAEILRLKMLNSAVTLGDGEKSSDVSTPIQGLLDRFLEQVPSYAAAAGAAVSGDDSAIPEEAYGEAGIEAIIGKASRRFGVDRGLIKAIIKAESDFNPRAVSPSGAQGLMQLMPATARGLGVRDPFDPEQNVMAGTRFLKDLLQRYGNLDEALAAYNWGPGNLDRHGTDSLPRETRAYLGRVKAFYNQYSV